MTSEELSTISAGMSAIAAIAALIIAWMSLRESRRHAKVLHRTSAHAIDLTLQSRLDPMYPELRRALGQVEDGVPAEIRNILVPFFVLYSDSFTAWRDGLLDDDDWLGLDKELTYWAQKPNARRAWSAFRNQTWTPGFAEHVDRALEGPPAYPKLEELSESNPEIVWHP